MQHMDVCCVRGHMYSQSFRCRLRQQVLSDLNLPGNINLKCVRASAAPVYFHARSCSRMTPQEVAHILRDPHAVPDSDDEEDDRERSKVRISCSQCWYWSGPFKLGACTFLHRSRSNSSYHCFQSVSVQPICPKGHNALQSMVKCL